jgi:Rrf2 family transcriptional regulator, iron-sulfur cluster assembly transcription factor
VELSLGRKADYAIRATVFLARRDGGRRFKVREIAEEMEVPASYLPQIMAELVRSAIVSSEAGPRGGYSLARQPAAISLLDVIEAVEGYPASQVCVIRGGPCRWDEVCAIHVPWSRAQGAMVEQLRATSFAAITAHDAELEAGTFVLPPDLHHMARRLSGEPLDA